MYINNYNSFINESMKYEDYLSIVTDMFTNNTIKIIDNNKYIYLKTNNIFIINVKFSRRSSFAQHFLNLEAIKTSIIDEDDKLYLLSILDKFKELNYNTSFIIFYNTEKFYFDVLYHELEHHFQYKYNKDYIINPVTTTKTRHGTIANGYWSDRYLTHDELYFEKEAVIVSYLLSVLKHQKNNMQGRNDSYFADFSFDDFKTIIDDLKISTKFINVFANTFIKPEFYNDKIYNRFISKIPELKTAIDYLKR